MDQMLAELNELREADGKIALKKWSGTEEELKRAIFQRKLAKTPQKDEATLIAEYLASGGRVIHGRAHLAKGVKHQGPGGRRSRRAKARDRTKPALTAATRAKDIPSDCFTLVEMASKIGMTGVKIRSIARKRTELATMNVASLGRWVFRRGDWDRIAGIIRGR